MWYGLNVTEYAIEMGRFASMPMYRLWWRFLNASPCEISCTARKSEWFAVAPTQ